MLVKASLELPAFSTLDEMVGRVRIFDRIAGRIGLPDRVSRTCGGSTRSATARRGWTA
jgi:hypothetical protein